MCGFDRDCMIDGIPERSITNDELLQITNHESSKTAEVADNYFGRCNQERDDEYDAMILQMSYSWDEGDL